jgi:hypothetical protein
LIGESNLPRISKVERIVDSGKIARHWLALGVRPVPLAPKSKRPKGEREGGDAKGWTKLRVTEDTVPQFFDRGDNVGALWGEPSDWLVDVDLDTQEACLAARRLLPETFTYGRRSAPGSHYIYRCSGIGTYKFQTKHLGTIVEIRSTGSQTVLPLCIHPEGERYRVDNDVDFTQISKRELEKRAKLVAAAAIGGYYYPDKGARHDFVHALAGGLLWNGWVDTQVEEFMDAVFFVADTKEHGKSDRMYEVKNTIEHFKSGDRICGWPTLSQFMPGQELEALKKLLGLTKGADNGDEPPENVAEMEEVKIKPELLEVPGLIGEIANWAASKCFVKQPLFDIAVGLTSVAMATKNKYLIDHWDTPLQPYILMLAPTASGKDSAMTSIFEVMRKINLESTVFQGFQSYHAMLDRLGEPPFSAIWLWDEAARKLKSAGKAQGGQDFQILTYLLSLYGKANTSIAGMPGRKASIKAIDRPFFTVVAAAQPMQLVEAITESDVSLGLVNRFILLDAGEKLPRSNIERNNIFPARIEDALKDFDKIKRPGGPESFIHIGFETQEAYRIFTDFNEFCRENSVKGGGWEMWGRSNQNALICAGLVAVGINPKRPKITEKIANWAVQFVSWCSERWSARVEQSASRSVMEIHSKYVQRIILTVKSLRHRANGRPNELKVVDRGMMPRSMLVRLSRHLRGKDLDDVITQLILADVIATGEVEDQNCYWIKDSAGRPR